MRKFNKVAKALLFFCFTLAVVNCTNEEIGGQQPIAQDAKIIEAMAWFKQYESNGNNYDLFRDSAYDWSEANITKSEDGTETIIVPVIKLKEDENEIWSQKLYLYKLGVSNYEALLFEIYPVKNVQPSSQTIDGGDFNGYVGVWDLKRGFVRASRFKNNQVIENGTIEALTIDKNMTNKAPAILPCTDEGCQQGPGGLGDPIQLKPVVVTGPSKGAPIIYTPRAPVTGGTNPGGFTSPGGGGSSGGGTSAATKVNIAITIVKNINGNNLNPCAKAILEKLKNIKQYNIASIILKLNGNSEVYTLTFEEGDVAKNAYGATNQTSYNCYTTKLNKNFLNGDDGTGINKPPTDLAIAAVMIHETVHAYFLSLFDDYKNSGFKNALDDYDFLYQKYETKTYIENGENNAHHAQIWNNYIDYTASALQEYDTGFGTGSPSQFYRDLMIGTLMNTDTFKNKYPNGSLDYYRIKNTFYAEKNNSNNDPNYKPKGKPCK